MYMTPQERRRQLLGMNADPEDRRVYSGDGGDPSAAAAGAAAAGGAGAAAGAMPWVNAIAGEIAQYQQEQEQRRQAKADLAAQYAASQGDFPMYGYQAARKNRAINDSMGGAGLGSLRRLGRGLGIR